MTPTDTLFKRDLRPLKVALHAELNAIQAERELEVDTKFLNLDASLKRTDAFAKDVRRRMQARLDGYPNVFGNLPQSVSRLCLGGNYNRAHKIVDTVHDFTFKRWIGVLTVVAIGLTVLALFAFVVCLIVCLVASPLNVMGGITPLELSSVLREAVLRGELEPEQAERLRARFETRLPEEFQPSPGSFLVPEVL